MVSGNRKGKTKGSDPKLALKMNCDLVGLGFFFLAMGFLLRLTVPGKIFAGTTVSTQKGLTRIKETADWSQEEGESLLKGRVNALAMSSLQHIVIFGIGTEVDPFFQTKKRVW